jgi:hypothetical protein
MTKLDRARASDRSSPTQLPPRRGEGTQLLTARSGSGAVEGGGGEEGRGAEAGGSGVLGADEIRGGQGVDGGSEDEGGALDPVDWVHVVLPPGAAPSARTCAVSMRAA